MKKSIPVGRYKPLPSPEHNIFSPATPRFLWYPAAFDCSCFKVPSAGMKPGSRKVSVACERCRRQKLKVSGSLSTAVTNVAGYQQSLSAIFNALALCVLAQMSNASLPSPRNGNLITPHKKNPLPEAGNQDRSAVASVLRGTNLCPDPCLILDKRVIQALGSST